MFPSGIIVGIVVADGGFHFANSSMAALTLVSVTSSTAPSCTLDGRPPDGGQTAWSASEPTGDHALFSPYLWSVQETRETDIVKSLKIVSLLRRHQLQTQPVVTGLLIPAVLRNAESGQAGS